jgi:hypothetical protein
MGGRGGGAGDEHTSVGQRSQPHSPLTGRPRKPVIYSVARGGGGLLEKEEHWTTRERCDLFGGAVMRKAFAPSPLLYLPVFFIFTSP